MSKHTPTPWRLDHWGNVVDGQGPVLFSGMTLTGGHHPAQSEADHNRDLVVRAVNSHAALVDALEQFMTWLDKGVLIRDITKDAQSDWAIRMMHFVNDLNKAKAALNLAKEKP